MERMGWGNCVIVVINDGYLRSKHCMFELMEIAEAEQFHDRVFPVMLGDADVYDPVKTIGYVKHWEEKKAELTEAMKSVDQANLQGTRDEIDLYDRTRDEISGLISTLNDMNTLTPEIDKEGDYAILAKAIEESLLSRNLSEQNSQVQTQRVELILEGEFSEFTLSRQQGIVSVLAALLRVESSQIRVLTVYEGSIVIIIEMHDSTANRLYEMARINNYRIRSLGVKSILIEGRETIKLSRDRRIYLLSILLWFLGLAAGLISVCLLIQDIPQPLDAVRWLIYRRGYPYFQAITFSALVITASVVIPDVLKALVDIEKLPGIVRFILDRLSRVASGYTNNPLWTTSLFLSLIAFISFLYLPKCLSSNAILVSFDILDNGSLVTCFSRRNSIL